MTPEAELIESVNALAALLEAKGARHRRAAVIGKPRAKIISVMRARWRKQMRRLLNDPRLKLQLQEADVKRTVPVPVQHIITTQVAGLEISGKEIDAFNGALGDAVEFGAKDVAAQLGKDLGSSTESFISEFLKDGGFQRIAADIDKTTVDRVSTAVADTYGRGGSYADVVKSIKDTFSGFSDYRAELIAQSELNDAYSQGQLQFARETGAEGKSWDPDGEACPICMDNVDDGVIPIDDDFSSGDDAPGAHPGCDCSLEIHAQADE